MVQTYVSPAKNQKNCIEFFKWKVQLFKTNKFLERNSLIQEESSITQAFHTGIVW